MVFPLAAAVAGAVGIGQSLYGASQAKKASKAQLRAQQEAEAAKLAAQREAFNTVQGLNTPYVNAGNAGLDALMQEFGLAPGGGRSQAPQGPMSYDAAGNLVRGPAPMAPNYGGGGVRAPGQQNPGGGYGPTGPAGTYTPPPGQTPFGQPGTTMDWTGSAGAAPGGGMGGALGSSVMGGAPIYRPKVAAGADPRSAYGPADAQPVGDDFGGPGGRQPTGPRDSFGDIMGGRPNKTPGGSAGGLPAYTGGDVAPQGGGYLDANPDVAAFARDAVAQGFTPEGWSGGVIDSPEEAAQYHYETYGQQEGRQMPMGPGQQGPIDYTTAERPMAPTAPQFERPDAVQFGDYGQAPNMDAFFSNFQADPGYQFRLNEGLRGVNAASAARGKLRSGDAAKALQERGDGLASQEYGNWFQRQMQKYQASRGAFEGDRNFAGQRYQFDTNRQDQNFGDDRGYGTGLWQFGVNRGDQLFNDARDYQTGRIDQRTNNLFDLAGIGQNANRTIGNAATGFANAQSNSAQASADARSNYANQRANTNTGLVGNIAGAATNLFANWGGGSSMPKVITNRGAW